MAVELLDTTLYGLLYPDLKAAGLFSPSQLRNHFLRFGANEGRTFSRFINLNYYKSNYADLGQAGVDTNLELFNHVEQFGAAEGRRLGVTFSPLYYRAVNNDLKLANLSNEELAQHYETFGIQEGRTASEFFNPRFYLDTYADLKAAFGNNYQQATEHFLALGIREGRIGAPPIAPSFDPGSSPSTAYDLATLVTKPTLSEFVGISDPQDYYRIILDKPSNLNLNLSGLTANTTLKLFADLNGNGSIEPNEELSNANGSSASPAVISKDLAQGTYFVDVVTGSPTGGTAYNLTFAATDISGLPTDPGNTPSSALELGTLSGSRTLKDSVGPTDTHDFYRFNLVNPSNFNLSLSDVSDSATATLAVDSNNNSVIDPGETLGSTSVSGSGVASLARSLGAGTYFIDISTLATAANTSYTLTLSA